VQTLQDAPGFAKCHYVLDNKGAIEMEDPLTTTSSNLVRLGAGGFVLGGIVWLVGSLTAAFANPLLSPGLFYYYAGLSILARVLLGVGTVGLHALQKESYGRIGRAGLYTVLAAIVIQISGMVGSLAGSPALTRLVSPVGLLVLIVGFVLYGAASLQARVLPRWYSVLLIVFVPVSVALPAALTNIWLGAVLLVLGFMLWSRREAPAEQPPRVR
jgi:hypothetical protein